MTAVAVAMTGGQTENFVSISETEEKEDVRRL